MIDPSLRNRRIVQEAHDPATAVILLDFVLGYGAHPDPAGATAGRDPRGAAHRGNRRAATSSSSPRSAAPRPTRSALSEQEAKLRDAGVIVLPDNASAARLAGLITQALHT